MAGFTSLLLCVTEDDNAAVRYVARLAAATGADLTIADVIEEIPSIARRLLPRSWNLPALVRTQKQARLESSTAVARRLGARPKAVLLNGSPIKALVREEVRGRHDLLAVGAPSSGTVQCVGASATRLLREVPCPVLLVHSSRRRRRPRVLVAVDSGPFVTKRTDALTAKLLEAAIWFAEKHEGEINCPAPCSSSSPIVAGPEADVGRISASVSPGSLVGNVRHAFDSRGCVRV